jgi:predicted extracellular nuclease
MAQTDGAGQYFVAGVAFYNVENLFDTINQNGRYDLDYTPEGSRQWDTERYNNKLNNIASAIIAMATPETPNGPGVVGLAEVENEGVVRDLAARIDSRLQAEGRQPWGLKYVHHDSPDRRGIDVALLYNPDYFEVTNVNNHRLTLPDEPEFRTRDQLVVSGNMLGCPLSVVVNHWPSRLGGQKESEYRRVAAGALARHVVDSIRATDPAMGVIVMGDLNDDPADKSVTEGLGAVATREAVTVTGLYNPFTWILENGVGTLCYQGKWNLFDQIIVSGNMVKDNIDDNLTYWKATVHNGEMLRTHSGKYKNYPRRTFSGSNYLNGYSDHFPTEIFLIVKL